MKVCDKSEYMKIGPILGRAIFQSPLSSIYSRRRFLFGWQLCCVWGIESRIYLKMYEG